MLAAEYRGDRVIAAAITTLVFGIAFVSMRFYTRLCIVRKASSDDWLILVALVRLSPAWLPVYLDCAKYHCLRPLTRI